MEEVLTLSLLQVTVCSEDGDMKSGARNHLQTLGPFHTHICHEVLLRPIQTLRKSTCAQLASNKTCLPQTQKDVVWMDSSLVGRETDKICPL